VKRRRIVAARRRWLSAALAAACAAGTAHAMDPDRALSQYVRDRWGTERGFPGGGVHAISQTTDGYLWMGTDKGLVRFDGLLFRPFPDQARAPSRIAQVLGLTADAQGDLWARLGGPRVLRLHDGAFEPMRALETTEDAVTAMARGRDGNVLIAGIVNGALRWRGNRFEAVAPGASLPVRSPVTSIAEAPDGGIWMGTLEGLFYLSGGRATPVTKGLPDPRINAVLLVGPRDVWVGTHDGVVRWNGTELTSSGLPPALRHVDALALSADRESNVWIATTEGLLRVNAHGVSVLEDRENVADGRGRRDRSRTPVTALFEDREGSLWMGTPQGIERLRDSSFTTYGQAEGLPSETSGPILVDAESRTWFAPTRGGLFWLRSGQVGQVAADGLSADVIYSIAGSRTGLWVGRKNGGLTHLAFRGDAAQARTYRRADGLAANTVYAVHESREGAVWAGTLGDGVSRLHDGRFATYTVEDGLVSNTVTAILDSADGTTWLATPSGLGAFGKGVWRSYTTKEGMPSDDVNCLLEDSTGTVWIGTGDGLAFFASGRVQVPPGWPASLHEQVFGLAEDRLGRLWIATSRRVLRAKRDELRDPRRGSADVMEYGQSDGLLSTEAAKRHRSVVVDLFGRIWFSMSRGLSVVDPVRATSSAAPLAAHIEALSADGLSYDLPTPRPIPPGPRRVTFTYSGVSLSAPDEIRFRYRLDGFDPGWSEPVSAREAVYTNLGPGTYQFRVTASNREGLWSGAEAAVGVAITPRVWQTPWFRFTSALAGALVLLGLYRLRLHRLTRQLGMRFEERLAERTRIAQELHDTLLQGLLSASMQLHVAVDEVTPESPAKARLGGILELMGRVIDEGRNAVRGLRSAEHDFDDLEQSFSRVRHELGIGDGVAFRVIGEGQARPLNPLIRDDVYRIGREALVNAFRHSGATRIEVGVECGRRQLRVLVRDDGSGIDAEVLRGGRDGHWGLSGMRERAERIGGRLRVWSRPGAGTEIELSVPGHVAFRSSPSAGPLRWLRARSRKRPRLPRSR
jgi:signal transduction histidine kinase/ligand-binding sensor domain-containing protein